MQVAAWRQLWRLLLQPMAKPGQHEAASDQEAASEETHDATVHIPKRSIARPPANLSMSTRRLRHLRAATSGKLPGHILVPSAFVSVAGLTRPCACCKRCSRRGRLFSVVGLCAGRFSTPLSTVNRVLSAGLWSRRVRRRHRLSGGAAVTTTVCEVASAGHDAGLSTVPPRQDGSKRPIGAALGAVASERVRRRSSSVAWYGAHRYLRVWAPSVEGIGRP